jgi:prepilin-type processing-associated H-X9-DG protein
MQCTNHIKQLSLSLHNYHDVHQNLPGKCPKVDSKTAAGVAQRGTYHWGPALSILPYIEQQARYDGIMTVTMTGTFYPFTANAVLQKTITVFCCPSDQDTPCINDTDRTRTNFVFSNADVMKDMEVTANDVFDLPTAPAAAKRSLFAIGQWKSFAACTDGTSNTVVVSECDMTRNQSERLAKASGANGIGATLQTNPIGSCLNAVLDTTDPKFMNSSTLGNESSTANTIDAIRGTNPWNGIGSCSSFSTVLPPNSPTCYNTTRNSWGAFSAASNHSGGVNCGLLDGSVRFVSETINAVTSGLAAGYTPQEKSSGKSDFGVWGALGSATGGESVSL